MVQKIGILITRTGWTDRLKFYITKFKYINTVHNMNYL